MPSREMQDVIDALRDGQKASAGQAPAALEQRRAAFAPAGRLHPVPDDVLVEEVTAGGVPAHWLTAPGADPGRVLLFLHGGGYELGSLRSDGELAARLGRAAGMDPRTPLASPLFAALSGLPPLLILVGTADLLLSDSERLAAAATQAGVDVTLQIGEGLPHVYQLMLGTPRQPRPPSRSGHSCEPGSANRTVHRQQAPRRPAGPLAAQRPESLLITPNGARPKAPPNRMIGADTSI